MILLSEQLYFLSEDLCPITKNDAKKLAEENKADLVIWGQYEDNCYEESNLRIRYSLAFDFYNAEQRPFAKDPSQFQPNPLEYGDTDKQLLPNLDTLRKGYLLKDIDFLSYYFLALAELKEGNYSKSVDLYRKALELKPCDPGALTFLGQSLLGSIRDSISYVKISGLFDHYISLCENAASLRYFKGVLYNEIGLLDSALYYFGEVKTLDNEFYYHLQARVLTAEIPYYWTFLQIA